MSFIKTHTLGEVEFKLVTYLNLLKHNPTGNKI